MCYVRRHALFFLFKSNTIGNYIVIKRNVFFLINIKYILIGMFSNNCPITYFMNKWYIIINNKFGRDFRGQLVELVPLNCQFLIVNGNLTLCIE